MKNHRGEHLFNGLAAVLPTGGFSNTTVLIVGDLMLDRYVFGNVERISPEAPVPVLTMKGERTTVGGAGNVALNVVGLGAQAIVVGVVGDDAQGARLTDLLEKQGIDPTEIAIDAARPTTCKTRLMCGSHQIVRVDEELTSEIPAELQVRLLERVTEHLNRGIGAVVLSDYSKGTLGSGLTKRLIHECLARGTKVFVDPKKPDYSVYSNATCITPNLKEFYGAIAPMGLSNGDFRSSGQRLRGVLRCETLIVTQGSEGMTLFSDDAVLHLPALAEEVFDVSGAGDTVIACMAAAIGNGLGVESAAELANVAASLVVRKVGTAAVQWEELVEYLAEATTESPLPLPDTSVAI